MKKNSTPVIKEMNQNKHQDTTVTNPSKHVVDFVRQFARVYRAVSPENRRLQPIVLN